MNIEIIKDIIDINEMTRSGEKRISTNNILVCSLVGNSPIEYIKGLSYQDKFYMSYHYIINKIGKIINIVPENEVTYSTYDLVLDLSSISIAVNIKKKECSMNEEQKVSLVKLLKYIQKRYITLSTKNVFLQHNFFNTREFEYYIDNYYEFLEVLKEV